VKEAAVYKKRNSTQNHTKIQTTQNRKQRTKPGSKYKKNIKIHQNALPSVLTIQERRYK
jgi:hypothetical protein